MNQFKGNESDQETGSISSFGSSTSFLAPIEAAREENPFDAFIYVSGRKFFNDENIKFNLPRYSPDIDNIIRKAIITRVCCIFNILQFNPKTSDEKEAIRATKRDILHRYCWKSHFTSPMQDTLSLGDAKVLDVGVSMIVCSHATYCGNYKLGTRFSKIVR